MDNTSDPHVHLCRAVCHHVEHSVDRDHCKGIGSDGSGVCMCMYGRGGGGGGERKQL